MQLERGPQEREKNYKEEDGREKRRVIENMPVNTERELLGGSWGEGERVGQWTRTSM